MLLPFYPLPPSEMSGNSAEDIYEVPGSPRMGTHDRLVFLEEQITSLRNELANVDAKAAAREVEIQALRGQLRKLSSSATPSPAFSSTTHSAPSKNLAVKPDPFDGKDYKGFIRTVKIYFAAYSSTFALDDERRILYVLSLMRGGLAGTWAENYVDQNSISGSLSIPDGWTTFLYQLDQTFGDPNEVMHAQTALLKLKQDGRQAEEFFARFDTLRRQAGYVNGYDEFLIRLLETALDAPLVSSVLGMYPCPATYNRWKEVATRFDNQRRRLQEINRARGQPTTLRRPTGPLPRPMAASFLPPRPKPTPEVLRYPTLAAATAGQPATAQRDGSGVTFGGLGQPMDVSVDNARRSGACYLCAKKGHMARVCPERSMRIRAVLESMTTDDREAWAEEIGQLTQDPAESDDDAGNVEACEEDPADATPQDFV